MSLGSMHSLFTLHFQIDTKKLIKTVFIKDSIKRMHGRKEHGWRSMLAAMVYVLNLLTSGRLCKASAVGWIENQSQDGAAKSGEIIQLCKWNVPGRDHDFAETEKLPSEIYLYAVVSDFPALMCPTCPDHQCFLTQVWGGHLLRSLDLNLRTLKAPMVVTELCIRVHSSHAQYFGTGTKIWDLYQGWIKETQRKFLG